MHPYDQFFYDVSTHNYTVDRFLADLTKRYGGIDALLMWPTCKCTLGQEVHARGIFDDPSENQVICLVLAA